LPYDIAGNLHHHANARGPPVRNVIRSIALMAGLVPLGRAADAPDAVPPLTYTTGKGHQTRTIGTVDHIAAVVPVADASAVGAGK
jgi:hypothetical protein